MSTDVNFYDWLRGRFEVETQKELSAKTGIGQSSLSRWKNSAPADFESCRTVADTTHTPIIEVLIAAGLVGADEAGVTIVEVPRSLSDAELAEQVSQRILTLGSAVAEMRDHVTRLQGKLQAVNDIARDKQHDSGVRAELRQALRDESA